MSIEHNGEMPSFYQHYLDKHQTPEHQVENPQEFPLPAGTVEKTVNLAENINISIIIPSKIAAGYEKDVFFKKNTKTGYNRLTGKARKIQRENWKRIIKALGENTIDQQFEAASKLIMNEIASLDTNTPKQIKSLIKKSFRTSFQNEKRKRTLTESPWQNITNFLENQSDTGFLPYKIIPWMLNIRNTIKKTVTKTISESSFDDKDKIQEELVREFEMLFSSQIIDKLNREGALSAAKNTGGLNKLLNDIINPRHDIQDKFTIYQSLNHKSNKPITLDAYIKRSVQRSLNSFTYFN